MRQTLLAELNFFLLLHFGVSGSQACRGPLESGGDKCAVGKASLVNIQNVLKELSLNRAHTLFFSVRQYTGVVRAIYCFGLLVGDKVYTGVPWAFLDRVFPTGWLESHSNTVARDVFLIFVCKRAYSVLRNTVQLVGIQKKQTNKKQADPILKNSC